MANFVTRQSLPMYSHPKSPHKYSLPQLISCVLLKVYIRNISYRDLEELLLSSMEMQMAIGLRAVPDHSTLNRATARLRAGQVQRVMSKVVGLMATRMKGAVVFGCDSTGLKEDSAGFYYALRSGKKRKRWIKVVYLIDTGTQLCVSQVIRKGPSGDAKDLCPLEDKSSMRALLEVMDRGFDGKGNFRLGLPFRIIPPIRRGGSIRSWRRMLEYVVYLVAKWTGIYGKRWICETMNSVIKRKFGESIRERKHKNKRTIASLMAIAYNIHVIVRNEGEKWFFVLLLFPVSEN